jgi:hypothetical protein
MIIRNRMWFPVLDACILCTWWVAGLEASTIGLVLKKRNVPGRVDLLAIPLITLCAALCLWDWLGWWVRMLMMVLMMILMVMLKPMMLRLAVLLAFPVPWLALTAWLWCWWRRWLAFLLA